ncbi:hypothetical protein LCGC14_0855700 [marine sediment metagenome]|uniref:Uncharacterized protein n=1 Tax=marine sediment metagenome TaxID=412755 RepID=A0A0F9PDX3_9ZZZZ
MIYPEDYRFFHELDKPRKLGFDDVLVILIGISIIAALICIAFI